MKFISERKVYDTDKARVVATDWEINSTTWETLYLSEKGNFFLVHYTRWQGQHHTMTALTAEEAADIYERLPYKEIRWEEVFPDIPLEQM